MRKQYYHQITLRKFLLVLSSFLCIPKVDTNYFFIEHLLINHYLFLLICMRQPSLVLMKYVQSSSVINRALLIPFLAHLLLHYREKACTVFLSPYSLILINQLYYSEPWPSFVLIN